LAVFEVGSIIMALSYRGAPPSSPIREEKRGEETLGEVEEEIEEKAVEEEKPAEEVKEEVRVEEKKEEKESEIEFLEELLGIKIKPIKIPEGEEKPAEAEAPAPQKFKICPNCGGEIPADSVFCPLCGKRVEEESGS